MGTYVFRFVVPEKNIAITLHKGDEGTWIVGREHYMRNEWRSVCETELFEYAKHAFDAEVAKIENEVRYEAEGC